MPQKIRKKKIWQTGQGPQAKNSPEKQNNPAAPQATPGGA